MRQLIRYFKDLMPIDWVVNEAVPSNLIEPALLDTPTGKVYIESEIAPPGFRG
jgi:hypothetical protein